MKTVNTINQFIILRADGLSFSDICGKLNISKGTCSKWQREHQAEIDALRAANFQSIIDECHLGAADRLREVGESLALITKAIQQKEAGAGDPDFPDQRHLNELSWDKLLKYRLQYLQAAADIIK